MVKHPVIQFLRRPREVFLGCGVCEPVHVILVVEQRDDVGAAPGVGDGGGVKDIVEIFGVFLPAFCVGYFGFSRVIFLLSLFL